MKPVLANQDWRAGAFPVVIFKGYTSHFGNRLDAHGRKEPHWGLDIAAPLGSPVISWWSGFVIETIQDERCGLGVVIASGDYEHLYCHLQALDVIHGQRVSHGQRLGRIGITGRSSGPHLHWAIKYRGRWLNPVLILKAMGLSHRVAQPTRP